jgi:hypothetical protein
MFVLKVWVLENRALSTVSDAGEGSGQEDRGENRNYGNYGVRAGRIM